MPCTTQCGTDRTTDPKPPRLGQAAKDCSAAAEDARPWGPFEHPVSAAKVLYIAGAAVLAFAQAAGQGLVLAPFADGEVQIQRAIKQILRGSIPAPLRRAVRSRLPRREHLAEARLFWERHTLALVGPRRHRSRGRILCYHSTGQPEFGVNDVHPARFRRHIELSLEAGYRFVRASEIAQSGGGPKDLAISFDDGLKSVSTVAAPILREHGIPYMVFAVSSWSDMKHPWYIDRALDWRGLELLLENGAEVGSHSVSHPDFSKIDHQRAVDELCISREVIRQRLGFAPDGFAIPFGQSMNWPTACAQSAREAGYRLVYAQAEDTRPKDTVARTFVTKHDNDHIFKALLAGHYDRWEEWF